MEQKIGRYRWTICSLVFFATTINYLDRAVISLLKSTLTTLIIQMLKLHLKYLMPLACY
jgi:hypothetical protein